jgi:hypothetical protein
MGVENRRILGVSSTLMYIARPAHLPSTSCKKWRLLYRTGAKPMAMSSTSGRPAAFGQDPDHARQAAARRQKRLLSRLKADLIRAERVAAVLIRARELAMTARAILVAAAEVIPHLEQRQADELRKKVKTWVNELFVGLNEILAQGSMLIAMLKVPHRYLCEKLAKLAKIQVSKRRKFDEHVSKTLRIWFCSVIHIRRSGSTASILGGMKRNLTDVCEKLTGLSGDDVLFKLSLECGSIAGVVDDLKKAIAVIERTLPRGHDRGRPAGIRQYPELDALVYHLEFSAQLAGGKFTVHKKNGGKGTIIEALNLLRNVMLAHGEKLAAAIPLPAKHPISTYERAINEARKAAAATLGLAGRGRPRGRRLCPPAPPASRRRKRQSHRVLA